MTAHREPATASILAARIMRAYSSLSPYSAASLAHELRVIDRALALPKCWSFRYRSSW